MSNLESILQKGLAPGVVSGQSGATDFQMPPAFPFDPNCPPRTQACGRTGARSARRSRSLPGPDGLR
eukprot:730631-Lingulodinium_polyedra.AAC.1